MDRREFLSVTAIAGTTAVAGCGGSTDSGTTPPEEATADGSTDTPTDSSSTDSSTTGNFRLLISDRPADIGDFDSLDVTFDRARVHNRQSGGDDETEADSETGTAEATESGTETAEDEADGDESDGESGSGGGFTVFELDEPTVDLTQVVGERAIGVLDGRLEVGEYSKIELYVSAVDGVVDGESVDVKVPSNKLQLTKPFEITADGTVEFVFDINVVRKGGGGYNLQPVISESGVAGRDVDVEEVDDEDEPSDDASSEDESTEAEASSPDEAESTTATADTRTGA